MSDEHQTPAAALASLAMFGAAACMIGGLVVAILGANGYLP
jgi:hypothetical protein